MSKPTETDRRMAAEFASAPTLTPAVALICAIFQLCEKIKANKNALHHLGNRCHDLLLVFKERTQDVHSENVGIALQALISTLKAIKDQATHWEKTDLLEAVAVQENIRCIQRCHEEITSCVAKLQVILGLEIVEKLNQSEADQRAYYDETRERVIDIATAQKLTQAIVVDNNEMLHELIDKQCTLPQTIASSWANVPQRVAQQIQEDSRTFPTDFNLDGRDITWIGSFPVGGSALIDLWEGLYLGREKVAIKVVRAAACDPRSLQRFRREAQIWSDVWKADGGKHILPFYGLCQNDGPFPYIVSPWVPNGTAISYVKKHSGIDYRQLIRGIGAGIFVLHSMEPPVVHGNIKGSHIVIDGGGNPLLADFGVSRIVEDIAGVISSQNNGISDSYRWLAPELYVDEGVLSTSADVYAFGMTILELLTNKQPYSYIRHSVNVVMKANGGIRPQRPIEPEVIQRGLDDKLWDLMTSCWGDSSTRPSIQKVLNDLH